MRSRAATRTPPPRWWRTDTRALRRDPALPAPRAGSAAASVARWPRRTPAGRMESRMSLSFPIQLLLVEDDPGDALLVESLLAGVAPNVDVMRVERLQEAAEM